MSRRQAREIALQALFQLDLNGPDGQSSEEMREGLAIDAALDENEQLPRKSLAYARSLVHGTRENLAAIDRLIQEATREWKLERMACVDRNATRIAVYEMKFSAEKLEPKIAINEAVELAKKFGTDDASRYVNGILRDMI